jgi:hypothetical protein
MSVFKLTIQVPNHLKDKNHPVKVIEFESKDVKDKYVEDENRFCQSQIIKKWTTWLKEDRDKALIDLYRARVTWMGIWKEKNKKDVEAPELA